MRGCNGGARYRSSDEGLPSRVRRALREEGNHAALTVLAGDRDAWGRLAGGGRLLRVSTRLTYSIEANAFNEGDGLWLTPQVQLLNACSTVVFNCEGRCKVGLGPQPSCSQAKVYSSDQTLSKHGMVETSSLLEIVETMDDPEEEWRAEWPVECECGITAMQW